jgi:hypothetical protein
LWITVTFLRPCGVFEGEARDPPATRTGDDTGGLCHGPGVVVDGDEVLDADVKPLGILPHEDQIDALVASAAEQAPGRPHIGEQRESLAQRHVDGRIPATDGGRQGAFERQAGAPDALDGGLGQWIAGLGQALHAGELHVPFKATAGGLQDLDGGRNDLRPDTIPIDQGRRDRGRR